MSRIPRAVVLGALVAAMPNRAVELAARVGRPYPSPTRGEASIELSLPAAADVRADLFDVNGRLVRSLVGGTLPAGLHRISWDGRLTNGTRAPAGRSWMRLSSGGTVTRSSLIVLR